ncbi:sulfur oxidation c-type cytochrome SoxX [Bosea sp. (in: a-proteobacteria)]|jgi:sulfur-oxidizing protein SoxX|uniref:sulfur oxidation c-type cytochrome SoxX n=1 Tax=Bosea sp. (in: a-proteobacteria) TaxID=1871050 RepID=UPI001D89FE06|nr:sulfur oxidation c-type cytochrome SoxX [Bosea sp. (in: a-proteobacteria)]MBA4222855.1 sulfur oxidation c-type cytochrome SoxX [Methylobacterium sp.]MBR3190249.1 sulfur oxidation c-type cytochrome SoxX [Bosea sp. (in: a-proteobacteria)]
MIRTFMPLAALLLAAGSATAQDRPPQAVIDTYIKSTFGKASAEWQARIKPDESLAVCNTTRNNPSSAESEAMLKRESARVVYPADGKFLGDWKKGYQVANNGRGGQFSDPPGTVAGGNCFACHQLDPKEVSYGTLGPSLSAYGKDRKYDPETIKDAYTKIYNSMAVVPCSNMPRFGVNKVLDEQQIKDVMAYLFDPESPVNK